jgi:hypothetical protein
MPRTFTTGQLARHFDLPAWQVARAIRRGFHPEPPRIGNYRLFTEADLPRVEEALRRAGYLREGVGTDA